MASVPALVTEDAAVFRSALPLGGVLLGLDLGTRTIGTALCDAGWSFATAAKTLPKGKFSRDRAALADICKARSVAGLVLGLPLNMDDTENEMCARARKFGNRLHGRFHLPVAMVDERLSSFEAKGEVLAAGGSRDFGRHGVDDRAAVLILETWFGLEAEARN